ncbi:sugar phosphate isomerase/epimerase [Streptomyces sp. DH-12]|uniref:sugar phosphate isomerase/epimerase family protein n=1 Tax=unclassified Streptomyces TaxID=2593676 RepID=UPI000CCF2FB8|nr:sugar phosphate isomerase/epimerase family protein [Streptomyces sp. DH-12]PNV35864.1 sugar phosphate isomerase/epimerase [Streptomyces sp. DH-12]
MSTGLPWPLAYTVSGDDCLAPMPLGHSAPLAEAARQLAELGYDGVEVQVREVGARDAEALAGTVEAAGLKVLGVGTGPVAAQDRLTLTDASPDVRRHALSRLLGAARLAGALGVPVTLGQTRGTFLPGLADMQRLWAERAVERLAEEAAARGSRLLLEPQSRATTSLWHTPGEALAVIDSLDTPAGLVLDTHHLDAEGVDAVQAVTEHAAVTGCLQLAAPAGRGPLTIGDPRLPALLTALRAGGFTGWLTLEHTQDGDSTKAAARSWTALTDAATALS